MHQYLFVHDAADAELTSLVRAAADGDNAAWERLVTRFDRKLRAIARGYRLAPCEIDDVLQATWLALFVHIDRIREPGALGGWLATTTRRECLRLRERPPEEELADEYELDDGGNAGPEAVVLAGERRAALGAALATLPERHRRLMALLTSGAAVDYRDISRTLAMPVGSIGPIRARSLARLRRCSELRDVADGVC